MCHIKKGEKLKVYPYFNQAPYLAASICVVVKTYSFGNTKSNINTTILWYETEPAIQNPAIQSL